MSTNNAEHYLMQFAPKAGYSDDNVFITKENDRLEFLFYNEQAILTFVDMRQNSRGLVTTLSVACPPDKPILSDVQINLSSARARHDLAIRLAEDYQETYLPWGDMLEYAIRLTIAWTKAPPELSDISQDPQDAKIRYLLEPLLIMGLPNTLFSPGGRGKTITASYCAVLVTHGIAASNGLPFIPTEARVLFLDYEADLETHRRYVTAIENGMGLPHKPIYYMNLDQPLTYYNSSFLCDLINQNNIGLVIIDSMMAATALDTSRQTEAQVASSYYNLLRSLGCTTLTLDHTTKQSMIADDNAVAPYGTIVKFNRSRSQWELKSNQQIDDNTLEIALTDRKFNLGKQRPSIGVRIKFNNNGDELLSVEFSSCDIADNPILSKVLPIKARTFELLKHGPLPIKDIADELGEDPGTIRTTLNRYKSIFNKMGDNWGLSSDATP